MKKEINNNIIINQAGDDRIVLEQMSNGVYKCKEIVHNCKDLKTGIQYLKEREPDVKDLLNEYNSEGKK